MKISRYTRSARLLEGEQTSRHHSSANELVSTSSPPGPWRNELE